MPPEWEEDFPIPFEAKSKKNGGSGGSGGMTLRPPLYNAEDYTIALRQLFPNSHHVNLPTMFADQGGGSGNRPSSKRDHHDLPQEMGMKKFLNGSELLFKLEADLKGAYPTFVQELVSSPCEGVTALMDALKCIQATLDECTGLREQRKLTADEQKCLQCIKLCLRNIEAVSKLSNYSGGLYPLATATISTVSSTRIISLEILTTLTSEGGPDGHYKVSEAISTLRLRIGEPIRCKLLVGAISSSAPGTFQAKGIRFLTSWIASAPTPKNKVHIQCELEEAGFNSAALRKNAEMGGARESREVQLELDEWDRVAIDVDTLTRQNNQLRNSVSTLQQELATLKDKLRRMDVSQKLADECVRKRNARKPRAEELVTTPVDSEEEAEQIHQILEDLNNIVNSQMGPNGYYPDDPPSNGLKKEKEIVPVQLLKSPPPKKTVSPVGGVPQIPHHPRPWPGSSASDDDDSDIIENDKLQKPCVRKVVEQLENMEKVGGGPKFFPKSPPPRYSSPPSNGKWDHSSPIEPKPDYNLPNFHKHNPMLSKFANFKSPKLLYNSSSSPDSSSRNVSSGYAEIFEKSSSNQSRGYTPNRFSPSFSPQQKKVGNGTSLRRSESLHASIASIDPKHIDRYVNGGSREGGGGGRYSRHEHKSNGNGMKHGSDHSNMQAWKSMENLEHDENFTLRWRYPNPIEAAQEAKKRSSQSPSPKNNSKTKGSKHQSAKSNGGNEFCVDYRQNRFTKKVNGSSNPPPSNHGHSSPINIFSRYSKKSSGEKNCVENYPPQTKEKDAMMKMFSLPPIIMSQNLANHHITDLPSGLY